MCSVTVPTRLRPGAANEPAQAIEVIRRATVVASKGRGQRLEVSDMGVPCDVALGVRVEWNGSIFADIRRLEIEVVTKL